MLKNVPVDVCNAVARLHCTCGYQISVGLKTKNIPPYLWWYIYDEDILPARVYSPSLKSPDNVPEVVPHFRWKCIVTVMNIPGKSCWHVQWENLFL